MATALLFLGLPGCGKGTQAEIFCRNFNVHSYSLGELLRKYADSSEENSALIKSFIERGLVVPADLVNEIVSNILTKEKGVFILDGYPRSIEQARFLENYPLLRIVPIYFAMEEGMIINRILNRIQCTGCHKVYNTQTFQIANFVCDVCGSMKFYKRSDDDVEVLKDRINQFKSNTGPVIDFYKDNGILNQIDAAASVEQIAQKLSNMVTDLSIDFVL